MKFISYLPLVVPVLAAPALAGVVSARDSSAVLSNVTSLVDDIQQHTAVISNTSAEFSSTSTAAQNATAEAIYKTNLQAIGTDLASIQKTLSSSTLDASESGTLDKLLTVLSRDLEYVVDLVLDTAGLGAVGELLVPLNIGLDGLLGDLGQVLDDLLAPHNSSTDASDR